MWLTSKPVNRNTSSTRRNPVLLVVCGLMAAGVVYPGCGRTRPAAKTAIVPAAMEDRADGTGTVPATVRPATLPPATVSTTEVQQQWREQFDQVLAGDSDRLLMEGEPVTAEQLAELPQLDGKLTQLLIDAGGATDDSLQAIATVHSLVHLRLRESPISDAGLAAFVAAGLPELQILNIPQGQITARGIASLAALPKLVQLRLGGAQIDDAAVAAIAKLPKLRSLHLIGPSLTDAALAELAASPLLSTFYLDDCPLSDAAWEQLFVAKPNLHVHVDQAHHDRDPHAH